MHSFEPILRAVMADIRPMRILEWGPGRSTAIMRELAPTATIISTEHQEQYARIAREGGFADQVFIYDAFCPKSRYAAWTVGALDRDGGYACDLAFIDGRRRVECALTARMFMRPGGAIVVHDAHRWHYAEVLEYWLGGPSQKYAGDSMTKVWIV